MSEENESELVAAAKSGDRLRTLIALRDGVAERLGETKSAREWAALARRLQDLLEEIRTEARWVAVQQHHGDQYDGTDVSSPYKGGVSDEV